MIATLLDDHRYCTRRYLPLLPTFPPRKKLAMDPQDAVTLTQQAMMTALVLCAPLLLVGMLVGLLIGLAQALTQVQDQTVAFVPKLVAMVAVMLLCLPWLIEQMMEYSTNLFTGIPQMIMGS